jgi:hypothetical protein
MSDSTVRIQTTRLSALARTSTHLGTYLLDMQRHLDLRHIGSNVALQRGYVNGLPYTTSHIGIIWRLRMVGVRQ